MYFIRLLSESEFYGLWGYDEVRTFVVAVYMCGIGLELGVYRVKKVR